MAQVSSVDGGITYPLYNANGVTVRVVFGQADRGKGNVESVDLTGLPGSSANGETIRTWLVQFRVSKAVKAANDQANSPYTIQLQVTDPSRSYYFYDGSNPPYRISLEGNGKNIPFNSIDPAIGMS